MFQIPTIVLISSSDVVNYNNNHIRAMVRTSLVVRLFDFSITHDSGSSLRKYAIKGEHQPGFLEKKLESENHQF
jgi:hypothetical protein